MKAMKQIETIAKGQNFEAVNIGSWDEVITRRMRSFISLSRVKACTRLTAKSSLSSRDPLSVYRPMASEP